jgi:DNA repair protein RadA/Sms
VAKTRTAFVCRECGRNEARWLGHCPDCGAWDSFVEEVVAAAPRGRGRGVKTRDGAGGASASGPVRLAEVVSAATERFSSGIEELDRVLGGGIVPGSLVLVGGEPGIGKSTLLLQVLDNVAAGRPALLVCGEESAAQVKMRAERICKGAGNIDVFAETELETVLEAVAAARPALVVVDSVQTLYSDGFTSAPGSVSQVREAAGRFLRLAKESGAAVFLVGHVTKEGAIAGPRVLEHMVDTVLQFEGDRYRFYRTLRAAKNRFGSTNELGIFEMTGSGLKTVPDPSALFLSDTAPAAGTAVLVAVEGSRCFLVEVQALVNQTELAMPRRVAVGFDRNRLAMLVAVLGRHAGIKLSSSDVFVTIAGGIRIDEPAADLAVALAVASAQRDLLLPVGAAVFGEISLTGGLRSCSQSERRIAEAGRAGFDRIVVPAADARRTGGRVTGVTDVRQAFAAALGGGHAEPVSGATNDEWGV